jgi:hypothetical protein
MQDGAAKFDASRDSEQIVPMEIVGKRLRERAKQLGISNSEGAREQLKLCVIQAEAVVASNH